MNSNILIIGASSGIGRATAIKFSRNNWNVIAASRKLKLLKELSSFSLKGNHKKIEPVVLDITKHQDLKNHNSYLL